MSASVYPLSGSPEVSDTVLAAPEDPSSSVDPRAPGVACRTGGRSAAGTVWSTHAFVVVDRPPLSK